MAKRWQVARIFNAEEGSKEVKKISDWHDIKECSPEIKSSNVVMAKLKDGSIVKAIFFSRSYTCLGSDSFTNWFLWDKDEPLMNVEKWAYILDDDMD